MGKGRESKVYTKRSFKRRLSYLSRGLPIGPKRTKQINNTVRGVYQVLINKTEETTMQHAQYYIRGRLLTKHSFPRSPAWRRRSGAAGPVWFHFREGSEGSAGPDHKKGLFRLDAIVFADDETRKMSKEECKDLLDQALPPTKSCLLYTSPSPRDLSTSRMPSSA